MTQSVEGDHSLASNQAVRVPKTCEIVASALRRRIARGELAEGSMLPSETALVAQFGVSRPSVREALRVLESEGLVEVQRGSRGGGRVKKPEMDFAARYIGRIMQFEGVTIADVWQARSVIEPIAVRLLAERTDRRAAIAALEMTLNLTIEFEADVKLHSSLSDKFHEHLVQYCGNDTFAIMWGCLKEVIRDGTFTMTAAGRARQRNNERTALARRRLLELLEEGDGPAAEHYWAQEMQAVYRSLLKRAEGHATLVEVID